MNGREDSKLNDLFFVCSLIEYVARKTKNERKIIVNALGHKGLEHFMIWLRFTIARILIK